MGWGRWLLLGNLGQQLDIEDQRKEIQCLRRAMHGRSRSGSRSVKELGDRVGELERENDELRLYLASLVRYLVNEGVLGVEDFAKLVEEIDSEDGAADGGYEGEVLT